jgi:hypothetical protein
VASLHDVFPGFRPMLRRALADPAGWLNGAAGFLARGGILLFALPIWVLPTPVGVSLLLGPVDVTGPPAGTAAVMALVLGVAGAVLVLMAVAAAASDVAFHRRLFPGPAGIVGAPWGPVRLVAALVAIEAALVVPAALVAASSAGRLAAIGRQEYFVPTSLEVPFVLRVIGGARTEVIALLACLVAAEAGYAVLSRVVLRRAAPATETPAVVGPGPASRVARAAQAARVPVAWVAAWAVTAAFVLPGILLVAGAWGIVQDVVAGRGIPGTPAGAAGAFAAIALFVGCWGLAIASGGASSAIRAILWTIAVGGGAGDRAPADGETRPPP